MDQNKMNTDLMQDSITEDQNKVDTFYDIQTDPENEIDSSTSSEEGSENTQGDSSADTDESNKEETEEGTEGEKSLIGLILDFVEMFALSIFAVLLIFSFGFRICRVDGDSMNNTFVNGEKVIITKLFYTPERGDIITFHENKLHNKPLVKRIIATEGQEIEIDYLEGIIKVDGEIIAEDYVYLSNNKYFIYPNYEYDRQTKIYTATVPEGHVFVMGDNRNDSSDSRVAEIGFIDERQIIGKAILRLQGFTAIE